MRHLKTIASFGLKACLAMVALSEALLLCVANFSEHPFDLVVLFLALGMTVFCLFRSISGLAFRSSSF
jgi:tetrahydromethanopterin S-methyltransferase subunit E